VSHSTVSFLFVNILIDSTCHTAARGTLSSSAPRSSRFT